MIAAKTICKSILVAEDNDDIRDIIKETLLSEGYKVHTAKDGKQALAKLRAIDGPALVLLDLMMPVMSGWEFLDIQKSDPALRIHQVITISAVGDTESLEDQTPLKTAGSVQKPIQLELLLKKIKGLCEGSHSRPSAA